MASVLGVLACPGTFPVARRQKDGEPKRNDDGSLHGSLSSVVVIAPEIHTDDPLEGSHRDEVVDLRAERVALHAQEALSPCREREDVDLAELEGAAEEREVLLEAR